MNSTASDTGHKAPYHRCQEEVIHDLLQVASPTLIHPNQVACEVCSLLVLAVRDQSFSWPWASVCT